MADYMELAERCEKAKANNDGLFAEAFRALFPAPATIWRVEYEAWTNEYAAWQRLNSAFFSLLEEEAPLEAALILVPKRMEWAVGFEDGGPFAVVHPPNSGGTISEAATPALALCAAALRAIATKERPANGQESER